MFIQYLGFEIDGDARAYAFRVINPPEPPREFTVTVQTVAFRSDSLKLQDGPGICYAWLSQALQGERQEPLVERHFSIGERDIQEYLAKHAPPNGHGKKEET